jgi:hypothetical protein
VYFLGDQGLKTSSYIVYDGHCVSRSSFPSHFNALKIISLCEPAEPTCTCTKLFKFIITFWQILIHRTSLGLNQKHTYRHVALLLILYPGTQHFFEMFHIWTPWIRNSSSAHFSSWPSTFFSSTSLITNCT